MIPLSETFEQLLVAHEITREFLKDKNPEYQRVFLARSDPALNYGWIAAVLLNKIALQRLHEAGKEIGARLLPLIRVGSPPFRRGFSPARVESVFTEYPSVRTFTHVHRAVGFQVRQPKRRGYACNRKN